MTEPRTKALTLKELATVNRTSAYQLSRMADYFAKAALIAGDAQKERRAESKQCQWCFYLGRGLAGQAFTAWTCELCKVPQPMHHNTNVPKLCEGCADAFGLCMRCGGTQDCQQKSRFARRAKKAKRP